MKYQHRRPLVREAIDQLTKGAAATVRSELVMEAALRAAARVVNLILVQECADAVLYRSPRGALSMRDFVAAWGL